MEQTKAIVALEEDTKVIEYKARLSALRRDGVNKISEQQELIANIRKSKQLGGEEKAGRIVAARAEIVKAREVARRNRNEVAALQKEALAYVNETKSRVPISDWYDTKTGLMVGFKARSVIGGFWMKELMDRMTATKK